MARFASTALFDAMKMLDSCKVKPLTELNTAALVQHPDGIIEESELDGSQGRYIYKVELREKSGQHWEVDVDAASGEVIENHPHLPDKILVALPARGSSLAITTAFYQH